MNLSFASLWEKISDLIPEEDALICGDDVLSWKEFDVRASKLASALIENGLSKNSKVAIYLNNSNEYFEPIFYPIPTSTFLPTFLPNSLIKRAILRL